MYIILNLYCNHGCNQNVVKWSKKNNSKSARKKNTANFYFMTKNCCQPFQKLYLGERKKLK